jgi:hypothetical protein
MLHASMASPTNGSGVSGAGGEMLPPVELKANFSGGKMSSYEEGLMSSMGMRQASAAAAMGLMAATQFKSEHHLHHLPAAAAAFTHHHYHHHAHAAHASHYSDSTLASHLHAPLYHTARDQTAFSHA